MPKNGHNAKTTKVWEMDWVWQCAVVCDGVWYAMVRVRKRLRTGVRCPARSLTCPAG